ncbi:helix-turn-helix domain-containing protein [Streptomyces sp. NPDC006733]|uniref:TetR/AcrR family transcriptional regulator n=1 Tax=Streptomyces sp. NPDC006733 TaxID=3155460 RepID=UPI0033DD1B23
MRVSRRQAAANRERVVGAAAELFRVHGLDGVSIADIMRSAGLTHGGFYGQFTSKEVLAEEACADGVRRSVAAICASAAEPPDAAEDSRTEQRTALRRVLDAYLSAERRDRPQEGCTLAALAGDAGRGSPQLQGVFAAGVLDMARALGSVESGLPADDEAAPLDLPLLAAMVGAVVLSRAVHAADAALSDRILAETKERLADR